MAAATLENTALVFIRWNKIRSYTEKKNEIHVYPLPVYIAF